MLHLVVEVSGIRQQFSFAGDAVTMGRNEDNDLRIGSRFVSQHHCRLEKLDKGWKLIDLSSQNGTRVNGEEVSQKILKSGDCVEIGHVPIWVGEAPDEVTESLEPGIDEVTPTAQREVVISARSGGGTRGALSEELEKVLVEFRKHYGDERGLVELERVIVEITERLFPRRAFSMPTNAVRLMEVTKALNSELDLKRCLTLIMDAVIQLTDAERGFLILVDDNTAPKVKLARNFDQESVTKADMKFSRSLVDEVLKTGQPVVSSSAQNDRRFSAFESVGMLKLRSVLCLPFRVRGRTIGLIYLDHRFRSGAFTGVEFEFIEAFTDQAAIAIENARLYERNKKAEGELRQRSQEIDELNSVLNTKIREQEIDVESFRSHAPKKADFEFDYDFIIGDSPRMMEIFQLLERVIPSDVPILVTGESGTGKELIARAIHINSERSKNTFVKENCAAIPETLLESELFGYKKGAFTGADRDKTGLLQRADKGTLFLDEIGDISLDIQKKLLRVLQEQEFRPVGGHETIKVDVRFVTATNRDLRAAVAAGGFREDLYYRINVIGIEMPPLRERLEDIPKLVEFFLELFAKKQKKAKKSIDSLALKHLLQYHWPGNVRELENEVQRACAIGGEIISKDDFSKDVTAGELVSSSDSGDTHLWKDIVKLTAHQKEREIILKALEENGWKKATAAKALGISRPTLDGKIKIFGLTPYIKRGKAQGR
ncbi:MAG: sigma 54-interacting transcriptional regulator [Planctomycetota bacterium]